MTNFSFGRTDGRTERGNNNIPELSLESAGITNITLGETDSDDDAHELYFQRMETKSTP